MISVYAYKSCDSCRKALKWLGSHRIPHEVKAIRETPPTRLELQEALLACGGDLRRLFNTSGVDYREMGLKDQLTGMSDSEALGLLATHGNLVKRPFLIGGGRVLVGFKEDEWRGALL